MPYPLPAPTGKFLYRFRCSPAVVSLWLNLMLRRQRYSFGVLGAGFSKTNLFLLFRSEVSVWAPRSFFPTKLLPNSLLPHQTTLSITLYTHFHLSIVHYLFLYLAEIKYLNPLFLPSNITNAYIFGALVYNIFYDKRRPGFCCLQKLLKKQKKATKALCWDLKKTRLMRKCLR